MAFLLGWEIGFFSTREVFSRVSAKNKKIGCFFGVFWCFFLFLGGVFVLLVFFVLFSRVSAKNFFGFFFRRWHEQNREFPL